MHSAGDISVYTHQVRVLRDLKKIGAEEALDELIKASTVPSDSAVRDEVLRRIRSQRSVRIGPVLRIPSSRPTKWPEDLRSGDGYHWMVQRDFLRDHVGRSDAELDSLHNSSDEVLRNLGCPGLDGPFDVRGLAIGHIQSGKTQNFSAVIAKALDAGYRIVIVLSGMHNLLRSQTQKRLMRDLGRSGASVCEGTPGHTGPCTPPSAGLPRSDDRSQWVNWLTDLDPDGREGGGDFESGNFDGSLLGVGGKHVAVVKKEKTRLEGLNAFLEGNVPDGVPLLVIDDESDQASVDTGLDEHDPTMINQLIRRIIDGSPQSSYVGYTATPVANFLTLPASWAEDAGMSLYPKDFIVALPEPPGLPDGCYIGTSSLFGDEPYDIYREVGETEALTINSPPDRGRSACLRQAVRDYFLATAGRVHRSGPDVPCTMLVHTAWQMEDHRNVKEKLTRFIRELRRDWVSDRDATEKRFRTSWEDDFCRSHGGVLPEGPFPAFDEILSCLDTAIMDFSVENHLLLLNSDSEDELDFDTYPGLKAVLVGGNKLSRGLTIEGLLVSYYVRKTLALDTLLQMGRWFGYRGDYVDLTRIYTTQHLFKGFALLNRVELEIRDEIASLSANPDITPLDVPVRLSIHPGMAQLGMEFVAPNKMRGSIVENLSWAGNDARTLHPWFDKTGPLERNLEHTRCFVKDLGPPALEPGRHLPEHLPCWTGVRPEKIAAYIRGFAVDENDFQPERIANYIEKQNGHGELTSWFVVIGALQRQRDGYPPLDLGVDDDRWKKLHTIKRTRRANNPTQLGSIWDPEHEAWGLTPEQVEKAENYYEKYRPLVRRPRSRREVRDPTEALLVIYPISRHAKPNSDSEAKTQLPVYSEPEDADKGPDIIGIVLSFPASTSPATRNVLTVPGGGRQ